MRISFARSALLAGLILAACQDAPRQPGIPDVDSSDWATDPRDYGMSAPEFIIAESRAFFADFIGRVGLNKFFHFPGLATAEDRFVVSPNNDTVYSVGIVNVTQGFTLELPEMGDRFVSIHIVDENHMSPFYLYGGGVYAFSPDQFATDYVAIGVRTATDASESDLELVRDSLQPQYRISGAAETDDMPRPDLETLATVRAALLQEYSKLESTFGAMQASTDMVEDWEYFTYVTAGAWGLSPDETAMYKPYALPDSKGNTCYTATYQEVPVEEFFSITVYGPEKYLMSNQDNIVSSNRGLTTNADGSFTIAFGAEECRSQAPNYAYTPEDGWSLLLRAYKPDVEAFRAYQMPELVETQVSVD